MPSERPTISAQRTAPSAGSLARFFGGPPLSVIFRLVLLSILIGVILEVMGLDPLNIIDSVRRMLLRIWDMGFDAVRWLWRYLVLGAVIVIPMWLIVRLTRVAKGRPGLRPFWQMRIRRSSIRSRCATQASSSRCCRMSTQTERSKWRSSRRSRMSSIPASRP